ncbi:MAG: AAA domain-containing protein [Proteobacteria bacterium]|nr:AAA domain-containing protein [Pseudomonadota bacterium]
MKKKAQINPYIFFREATIRICGSLDIEAAMSACVQYLGQFMPATRMFIEHYEPGPGIVRTIAMATADHGEKLNLTTQIEQSFHREVQTLLKSTKRSGYSIVNRPEEKPITRHMLESLNITREVSILFTTLAIEDQRLGTVVLMADGKDRYTEEHGKLFGLLKEPFAIAMANARRHRMLETYKEQLVDDNRYLHEELQRQASDEIIGADFGLKEVMGIVRQVAPLDSPVLLLGETGVGKDVLANAIHAISPRRERPFITVNSGAIPANLIDSELFGHEKGAFTGAGQQKRGRFERAHTGTIFLDEIGELPPEAQVRLLRVLQNKEIERVGGTRSIKVDVRIIAATNKNLEDMVVQGRFREDLWFRLNVVPIGIPPLRARKGDIPALLHHFIERKSRELKHPTAPDLAAGALDQLQAYDWPGNVRELENIVERALILQKPGPLSFELLGPVFGTTPKYRTNDRSTPHQKPPTLDQVVASHIRDVLQITEGKVHGSGGAAALLGMKPSTLRYRMNKLGIPYGRKK